MRPMTTLVVAPVQIMQISTRRFSTKVSKVISQIIQYPASGSKDNPKHAVRFKPSNQSASWQRHDVRYTNDNRPAADTATVTKQYTFFHDTVVRHFLPSNYPTSVDSGYAQFCTASFVASVAGSASMVLSTQALLLGMGVVGSGAVGSVGDTVAAVTTNHNDAATASVMAGALNWVLKDGAGQLGGIFLASRMGETRTFDAHPKQWRMVAALALDGAALLELAAPWVSHALVLPVACVANVLKNIGFLTSSASRAAIHQSLAMEGSNNLADVTAKAASQSMASGLFGTALGIGLSTTILNHDVGNYVSGFAVLATIHQSCNYIALQHVAIPHLNRPRLYILLQQWCKDDTILTPHQVAKKESALPGRWDAQSVDKWLRIGSPLETIAPHGYHELLKLIDTTETFVLKQQRHDGNKSTELVFLETACEEDLIRGMLQAVALRENKPLPTDVSVWLARLRAAGWNTDTTNIEPAGAVRLSFVAP